MKIKDILLAIFVAFAWGSYFVAGKIALVYFPPMLLSALRFFLLFLCTFPFIFKEKLPTKRIFALSMIIIVDLYAITQAIHFSSNLAPIILVNELAVPIATLFGAYFLKEKITWKNALGICIALIGLAIVVRMRNVEHVSSLAISLTAFAAILFATYNLLAKQLAGFNILTIFAQMSILVGPTFLLLSFFQEDWPTIETISVSAVLALFYCMLVCTLISHYIWFYLLNKYPMNKVVPFTLLSPVFGCLITMLVFDEQLTFNLLFGGCLVIIGLAILQIKKSHAQKL